MTESPKAPITMMSPQSLPPTFNYAHFVRGLTMLDIKLRDTLRLIEEAKQRSDENALKNLEAQKQEQTEAIMQFLTKAYQETDGKIAELPEFNPKNERGFKLAIPDDGQLLWFRVKYRVQLMRERQQEAVERVFTGTGKNK